MNILIKTWKHTHEEITAQGIAIIYQRRIPTNIDYHQNIINSFLLVLNDNMIFHFNRTIQFEQLIQKSFINLSEL